MLQEHTWLQLCFLVATTCSKEIVPTIRFFKSPSSGSLVNSSLITGSTNDPWIEEATSSSFLLFSAPHTNKEK